MARTGATGPRAARGRTPTAYDDSATTGHTDRVRFHAWLQWLLEQQFREASGDLAVLQDLPIGVDGGGADAWAWQDTLVDGATVGAPPDIFNAQGQTWGSPPFAPWRLRAANYEPFVAAIRATMAGGGGIRIDHVMGLFRLWWIPKGGSPADGAYVRYPADDLLDIVALESHRARSVVVGEDLGTVEPGVREALAEHAVLSYRLLWFEQDDPTSWPALAMGAITTHDLPTITGLWTGIDLEDQVAHVPTPRPALERDRAVLLAQLPTPPRRTATARGGSRGRGAPTARRGTVRAAVGHPRGRRRAAAATEHAGDVGPAQLVDPASRRRRRPTGSPAGDAAGAGARRRRTPRLTPPLPVRDRSRT